MASKPIILRSFSFSIEVGLKFNPSTFIGWLSFQLGLLSIHRWGMALSLLSSLCCYLTNLVSTVCHVIIGFGNYNSRMRHCGKEIQFLGGGSGDQPRWWAPWSFIWQLSFATLSGLPLDERSLMTRTVSRPLHGQNMEMTQNLNVVPCIREPFRCFPIVVVKGYVDDDDLWCCKGMLPLLADPPGMPHHQFSQIFKFPRLLGYNSDSPYYFIIEILPWQSLEGGSSHRFRIIALTWHLGGLRALKWYVTSPNTILAWTNLRGYFRWSFFTFFSMHC